MLVVAACGGDDGGGVDSDAAAPVVPEVIAEGVGEVGALVVDDAAIYAIRGDEILEIAGGEVAVIAPGRRGPAALALTAGALHWVDSGNHAVDFLDGAVVRFDRASREVVELAQATLPVDVAADDAFVYWVEVDGQELARAPAGGGDVETLELSGTSKVSVALRGTTVGWTAGGDAEDVALLDLESREVTVISTEEYAPADIVLGADEVAWIEGGPAGTGEARVRAGAPPRDLTDVEPYAADLLATDGALYWRSGDRIRCLAGTVVESAGAIGGLAAHAGTLYWSDPDGGRILAAPAVCR